MKTISDYCPSGQEKSGDGSCVSCSIGYYKDNNVDVFSVCTACDAAFITGRTGAEAATECNIGMYMVCDIGYRVL